MNVLIPKKGSKEQLKVEEGRLLYAMVYGKQINLARLVVERVRAAMGRKSTPICYGMHLTELMIQAGVDLTSAGDEEFIIRSVIDHHTLRRLGYKLQLNTWEYVGRGRVTSTFTTEGQSGQEADTEGEEDPDTTAQEESTVPSQPHPPRSSSFHLASQISNLATKSEIAHLRQFMAEQFQLLQATLLSKLESMDSRLQACETHILHHSRSSPVSHHSPSDPKGKTPMVSPGTSPHTSPAPTPHLSSPAQKSPSPNPIPVSSHSSSSSSSSPSDPEQFELVARTPTTPTVASPITHSQDSEATPSDPTRFLTTPPPSPPPPPPPPRPDPTPNPPPPPPPPTTSLVLYSPSPRPNPTPYHRRKQVVTKPGSSAIPPPE